MDLQQYIQSLYSGDADSPQFQGYNSGILNYGNELFGGGYNPVGGDPGEDYRDVYDGQYAAANPDKLMLGRTGSTVLENNNPKFYETANKMFGQNFTTPQQFIEYFNGPGQYGQDAVSGMNYFTPNSGNVRQLPAVDWEADGLEGFMDKNFLSLMMAGVGAAGLFGAAGSSLGGGLAGEGAASGIFNAAGTGAASGAGYGAASGLPASYWGMQAANGLTTPFTQEGAGMFDWLDEFMSQPWSTDPSVADLEGFMNPNYGATPNGQITGFDWGGGLAEQAGQSASQWMETQIANGGVDLSSLFGGQAPSASMLSQLGNFLKNPLIPGTNATGGNVLGALANYLMKNNQQKDLEGAANRSAQLNNPMDQPQRAPFQQAFTSLMTNPNSYQQTPFAQGMTNQVNNAFKANVSKYGPSGTQFSDYNKNYQNVLSADFFNLANVLSTAGGFNQGTGGAGNAYGSLAGAGANAGMGAWEGFGSLLSQPKQQSPFSSSGNNPFQNIFNQAGNNILGST